MMQQKTGVLYVVATPIGHLDDITVRALEVLRNVDVIAAEDTRHSKVLLRYYDIETPCIAYHDHNEEIQSKVLLERLKQGVNIALISDAGTPLISDPGYTLVKLVRAAGMTVTPIPGACAMIAALSVSGLPTDRFTFEGFLSAKSGQRTKQLFSLKDETRTLIFYESSHRIEAMLADLAKTFGESRSAVLARELTKTFETIHAGTVGDLIQWVRNDAHQTKGEFVVLVHGATRDPHTLSPEAIHTLTVLRKSLSVKQAVELTAEITGCSRNALYQYAIQ